MKKRYDNNKVDIDPGRLVYRMKFFKEMAEPDGSGGYNPVLSLALETLAARTKIGSGNQMAVQAGASVLNQDFYYTIRYRKDFSVEKDMRVMVGNDKYTIAGIEHVDTPIKWVRILCVKSDWDGEEQYSEHTN